MSAPRLLFASDIATTKSTPRKWVHRSIYYGLLPVPVSVWIEWVNDGTAPAPTRTNPDAWNWDDVIAFIEAGAEADGSSPQPINRHHTGAAWSFTDVLNGLKARGEV